MRVGGKELFGRRNAPRTSKNEDIRIFPSWPHHGVPAQLRDLSPTGLRFTTSYSPQPGQVLKINGDKFLAIAQVLHVQQLGGRASIHGIFLGVNFTAPSGAFVSVAI